MHILQLMEKQTSVELEDREEQIAQLQQTVAEINSIFKELADLVHIQGAAIDSIEANMSKVKKETGKGLEELQQAKRNM